MLKRLRGVATEEQAMSTASGCVHPYPAVRLRGLPFGASKEEIADFLQIVPIDIVFQERGGRPNGVAFVLCANHEDHQQAISQDKQNLGTRYIEVFACIRTEFHRAVADEVQDSMRGGRDMGGYAGAGRGGPYRDARGGGMGDRGMMGAERARILPPPIPPDPATNPRGIEAVVKLRGLPFEASPRDVTDWINSAVQKKEAFLSQPVGAEDVVVATKNGTSIGVAFVEIRRYQDGERMLALDRKYFGSRYVEVNMSTLEEQHRLTGTV